MAHQAIEVLLVEDTPSDAKLAMHALRTHNLANRVQLVTDGAQALDFIMRRGEHADRSSGDPRLVLLDLHLPKVSGVEVLRELKSDPETRGIPVVVLTSSRDDRDLEECYRLGVNSYIVKPLDFAQFSDAVREIGCYWLLLNEPPKAL